MTAVDRPDAARVFFSTNTLPEQINRGKTFELSPIAQCRFGFDDILVVLRFAVLCDPYELPLRIAEHVLVLRGFL